MNTFTVIGWLIAMGLIAFIALVLRLRQRMLGHINAIECVATSLEMVVKLFSQADYHFSHFLLGYTTDRTIKQAAIGASSKLLIRAAAHSNRHIWDLISMYLFAKNTLPWNKEVWDECFLLLKSIESRIKAYPNNYESFDALKVFLGQPLPKKRPPGYTSSKQFVE